jgi:chromosome segregation ATPase
MMGQDDPTGGNPQDRINQLEQQAAKDKDALDKLLLAYQGQETEISDLKVRIEALNREIRDGIVDVESKETLLSNLRREKDDMEVQLAKANTKIPYLEDELDKTKELLSRETARLGSVITVAEEIDEENKAAVAELSARDDWYVQHMQLFEDLSEAIKVRHDMIDRAIAASKEIQSKHETFREQKQAVIEEMKNLETDDDSGSDDDSEEENENE